MRFKDKPEVPRMDKRSEDSGFSSANSESEGSTTVLVGTVGDSCDRRDSIGMRDQDNQEHMCADILELPFEFFYRQDNEGDTRLHTSISLDLPAASCWLIDLAPEPWLLDIANDDGLTALHLASLSGQAPIVRRLVLYQANRLARTANGGSTALHFACAANDLDCAKALLEPVGDWERRWLTGRGRNTPELRLTEHLLEMRNYNGETCLHIAARQGHLELARQLLRYGADVNAREGLGGMTALHLAILRGHEEVAWMLANKRPSCIDVVTYAGLTAYQLALNSRSFDRWLTNDLVRLNYVRAGGDHRLSFKREEDEEDVEKELSAFARLRVTCMAN